MHLSFKNKARSRLAALLSACVFGLLAAGCHHNNLTSGAGAVWTSLSTTDDSGQFTSYIVTVDSVSLIGKLNGQVNAIQFPERVDFTKLTNLSELWSTASIPVDTYTSATITLDYTSAQISVMVNGAPVNATIVDPASATGAAPTTVAVTVNFDTSNQLTLKPTFATSNALRLAVNFDLSASNTVDLTASTPKVTVKPFMSISTTAPDNKLIRVRGPLINSSVNAGTYSVVVRPFFDEVNNLARLTLFNDVNSTIYSIGGITYVGNAGLTQLSQTSAGSTMTAAYTSFEPTPTGDPTITAGIFHPVYVVAGGTLEDFFTVGLEGDVIARSADVLTVRGATLFANLAQSVQYQNTDSQVQIGPSTQVTVDGAATAAPLDFNSISVGQHIIARGLYSSSSTATLTILDSTSTKQTDTGSVRLQSTQAFGTLISSGAGSLALNLKAINNWPSSVYNFAGNGVSAGQDPLAATYVVNTGALNLPAAAAGDPLWVDGLSSPFGSAPPDFNATAVNAEPTVSASLVVTWSGTGTAAPFSTLASSGLIIDLANATFGSGSIRVGAESIDIKTLSASPTIVPAVAAADPKHGLPLFAPVFSVGSGAISGKTTAIQSFNGFAAFVTQLNTTFGTPTPATRFVARGTFNRTANTFTASSIDVVL